MYSDDKPRALSPRSARSLPNLNPKKHFPARSLFPDTPEFHRDFHVPNSSPPDFFERPDSSRWPVLREKGFAVLEMRVSREWLSGPDHDVRKV